MDSAALESMRLRHRITDTLMREERDRITADTGVSYAPSKPFIPKSLSALQHRAQNTSEAIRRKRLSKGVVGRAADSDVTPPASHHPFHEPPSSTGSHPTVSSSSLDMSGSFSIDPEAESTRLQTYKPGRHRVLKTTGRYASRGGVLETLANTSVLRRSFPEWNAGNTEQMSASKGLSLDLAAVGADKENLAPHQPKARAIAGLSSSSSSPRLSMRPAAQTALQAHVQNESQATSIHSILSRGDDVDDEYTSPRPVSKGKEFAASTAVSFMLPSNQHAHFLRDLVSGTLEAAPGYKATSLFYRSGKNPHRQHLPSSVHVPEDEDQIFVSLEEIRKEVYDLQNHDDMVQQEAEKLQQEVDHLKLTLDGRDAQLRELRREVATMTRKRSDSAIGSDSDRSAERVHTHEKKQLENQIRILNQKLDEQARRQRLRDLHTDGLAAERDAALTSCLSSTNEAKELRDKFQVLQRDYERLDRKHQDCRKVIERHQSSAAEAEQLRSKLKAVQQDLATVARDNQRLERSNEDFCKVIKRQQSSGTQSDELRDQLKAVQQELASIEEDNQRLRRGSEDSRKSIQKLHSSRSRVLEYAQEVESRLEHAEQRVRDLEKQLAERNRIIEIIQAEDQADDESIDANMTSAFLVPDITLPGDKDFTAAEPDVAQPSADDNRASSKQTGKQPVDKEQVENDAPPARQPSMKALGKQPIHAMEVEVEDTFDFRPMTPTNDEPSVISHLPDPPSPADFSPKRPTSKIPALSEEAQRVLVGMSEHDDAHCPVCLRVKNNFKVIKTTEGGAHRNKAIIRIPRPVPVSDRQPQDGGDYTMRPARNPGEALAFTIHLLREEAKHLRMQVSTEMNRYIGRDASMGATMGKNIVNKIRLLIAAIDIKDQQIYALHDVLEGQKAAGQEMSQEYVDRTFTNLELENAFSL